MGYTVLSFIRHLVNLLLIIEFYALGFFKLKFAPCSEGSCHWVANCGLFAHLYPEASPLPALTKNSIEIL